MPTHRQMLSLLAGTVALGVFFASPVGAIAPSRLADTDEKNASDWLTYHGTYRSYHFSPLDPDQRRQCGDSSRSPGCISRDARRADCSRCRSSRTEFSTTPARTAALFALDGATGQVKWSYFPQARR